MRAALNRIETGYAAGLDALPDRPTDWDVGEQAIESTRIARREVPLPSARGVRDVELLWAQYDTERLAAKQDRPPLEATRHPEVD